MSKYYALYKCPLCSREFTPIQPIELNEDDIPELLGQFVSRQQFLGSVLYDAPRQYGLSQAHKHLPEMSKVCSLDNLPLFCPIVADFPQGLDSTRSASSKAQLQRHIQRQNR